MHIIRFNYFLFLTQHKAGKLDVQVGVYILSQHNYNDQ